MGKGLVSALPPVGLRTRAPLLRTPVLPPRERRPHLPGPVPAGARRPTRWCPTISGRSLPGKNGREKDGGKDRPRPASFRGRTRRAGGIPGPVRRPNVFPRCGRRVVGIGNHHGETSRPLPPRIRPTGSPSLPRLLFSRIRRECLPGRRLLSHHAEEPPESCPERSPVHPGIARKWPGRRTCTCSVRGEAGLSGRRSCLPRSSGHRWRSGPLNARGVASPWYRPASPRIVRQVAGVRVQVVDLTGSVVPSLTFSRGTLSHPAKRSPWPEEVPEGRPSGALFAAAHSAQHRRQLPRSCYAFRSRQSGCPSSPDSA